MRRPLLAKGKSTREHRRSLFRNDLPSYAVHGLPTYGSEQRSTCTRTGRIGWTSRTRRRSFGLVRLSGSRTDRDRFNQHGGSSDQGRGLRSKIVRVPGERVGQAETMARGDAGRVSRAIVGAEHASRFHCADWLRLFCFSFLQASETLRRNREGRGRDWKQLMKSRLIVPCYRYTFHLNVNVLFVVIQLVIF